MQKPTFTTVVLTFLALGVVGIEAQIAPRAPTNVRVIAGVPPIDPDPAYPSGWDDPIFANVTPRGVTGATGLLQDFEIITTSGDAALGCSGFTARRFRIRAREGVRLCGSDVTIEDFVLDIAGTGTDHADGIQAYAPGSNMKNIFIRRGRITIGGAANAAVFFADNARASFTIEDTYIDGRNAPNGALFVANVGSDVGCVAMGLRNVHMLGIVRFVGLSTCTITMWENVTLNGKPLARP